ncbi:ATP-dependent zinc metalloprotease FtsH [Raoultella terrigena]|uniref:ATP-dependent zinc metalloprotease FtsH n=2 Tax=Enterobacteriaceae TaxID=543 RepID=A0A3P8KIU3_RAOTE|nr:AAA family ATPase [Klebsiella pneumoniae]VDR29255.1 ATP-dependent zinc metalloprotease FtsH [Raoultella terrigena]
MKHGTFRKNMMIDGQYQVVAYVGESDFCELYRVKNPQQEVKFLQLLSPRCCEEVDLPALSASLSRASQLKAVNLLNCSPLQQMADDRTTRYFIMDFISGEPLSALLVREISVSPYESYQFALDLLNALVSAGKLALQDEHFVMTPNHIFIDYAADLRHAFWRPVCVGDFVKNKEQNDTSHIHLAYLSPEALQGQGAQTSQLFSLASILYRCLTGHHPWDYPIDWQQDAMATVIEMIGRTRLSAEPGHVGHSSQQLQEMFDRALKLEPVQRYQHASELQQVITRLRDEMFSFDSTEVSPYTGPSKEKTSVPTEEQPSCRHVVQGFDAIAGMEGIKSLLYKDIIAPLRDKERYLAYGIQPINGLLFYGPPGCGKTFIAQKLAEELGFFYLELKPSDLASTYIHGTQEKIGHLFRRAKANAPTLIFIDEVDAILPARDSELGHHGYASEVNEFLAQMNHCGEQGIVIVAATNLPERIDPAILRTGRLDKVIYIGLPDFTARQALFGLLLKDRPTYHVDIPGLAMLTEGYVTSDLSFMVNEAAKLALENHEPISDRHFSLVRTCVRPSVTEEQIRRYANFRSENPDQPQSI